VDFGLRIVTTDLVAQDRKLRIRNPQSEIRNS